VASLTGSNGRKTYQNGGREVVGEEEGGHVVHRRTKGGRKHVNRQSKVPVFPGGLKSKTAKVGWKGANGGCCTRQAHFVEGGGLLYETNWRKDNGGTCPGGGETVKPA